MLTKIVSVLFVLAIIAILYAAGNTARASNNMRTDAAARSYKPVVGDVVLYTYRAGVLRMRGPNGELWPVGGTVEQREVRNLWRSKRSNPGEPAEVGTPDYNSGPIWITFQFNGNVQEHQPLAEWYNQATSILMQ